MDAKTIYAQPSDIKSRTYLEYRKDMKKKAIAELEVFDWLKSKLSILYPNQKIKLSKFGGDTFLWFLRKGGVTREPDYRAKVDDKDFDIEFQYADKIDLNYFDFAVSKITKKNRKTGKREPHQDRKILYILKYNHSFAFFDPEWILKNGHIGFVDAWRKDAYRVPKAKFLEVLRTDSTLKIVVEMIDIKNYILNFQHDFIGITKEKLSYLLQQVIDEQKIVRIIPNDLDSFFKVCFILDNLNKVPQNINLWLVYLLSFISDKNTTEDLAKIIYCVDFLYSKTDLKQNELKILVEKINLCFKLLQNFEQKDGSFKSSTDLSPMDETRYALFSVNLLEDLTQDLIFYYKVDELNPVTKIYQNISYINNTYKLIKK
ncbi:MAG: hypothetical protein AUJ85_06275 [Elusimicrobia bacterium CG1_02_37_114]|nr:MAG: hypothetical protein AUJ85_06275 [Elusimicrobia bacterium CG1_02_37_114]